jgi:hypothetical protein
VSQAQKKILDIVRNQIATYGLEPVVKPQWANTGTILIEKPGEFGAVAKVTYSFQDDRFNLAIYRCTVGPDIGIPSQPPRQGYFDHYLSYSDQEGFAKFQRILQETMEAIATKKVSSKYENPGAATVERWAHYSGKLRHIVITFDDANNAEFYIDGVKRVVPVG